MTKNRNTGMSGHYWGVCPNCDKTTLKIELEENRGVCGLCYESLSQSLATTVITERER